MAPKYIRLADQLRGELPHMRSAGIQKLPAESAIMEQYQVSRQTVRQALDVLVSAGLVTKRHGSGTYLRGAAAGTSQIAVIASYLSDYIFPSLLRDIQAIFSEEDYTVSVYSSDNSSYQERQILQRLLQEPVAGILVEGSKTALPTPNLDLYEQLRKNGIPIVFLHGVYRELADTVCISDDNYAGGYQLVRHLLEKGHTQIAGIFKSDDMQGLLRYSGCSSALRDANLLLPDRHFLWFTTEERRKLVDEKNSDMMQRFFRDHLPPCTAVICYNDEIAYYLIQFLLSSGVSVPDDVAVVSFDNSYYSKLGSVPITSLGHASHAVGQAAAYGLLNMIRGDGCQSVALPWQLNCRQSG